LPTLQRIHIKGFKSIKELDLELRPMNVLIGANGAGKSNFVAFFKMLREMAAHKFQQHVGRAGFAQTLLHYGPKTTTEIEFLLEFREGELQIAYAARLIPSPGDNLVFSGEKINDTFPIASPLPMPQWNGSAVTRETDIFEGFRNHIPGLRGLLGGSLRDIHVYQFHDTTPTSRLMQHGYIGDNKALLHDAGNLAAFLYRLKTENKPVYRRIVATIRQVAPFFDDFVLDPTPQRDVMLNWRDKGSDQIFGPHQLSDGTLRAMALISLLLQPEDELPGLLIVDEPELGLHPYAVEVIAALFKMAALHTQVILCTQSPLLLDHFDPSDVIVVEREGAASTFRRLGEDELETWLERYSLGEIWQKNVIGGGPH